MKRLIILLISGYISLICVLANERDIFYKADEAFKQRVSKEKAFEALELYKSVYDKNKNNCNAAWRYSMACYFAGFEYIKNKNKKIELFRNGIDAGLVAIKLNPESAEAYFWTAINMVLYSETEGKLETLFSLHNVCKYLEKSIEIDPSYAYGGAYRVLGKINENLPRLLGGSKKKAIRFYRKAIEIAPDEPVNYIFAARLMRKKFKNKEAARKYAEDGLKIVIKDKSRHESINAQKEIRDFLKKISD